MFQKMVMFAASLASRGINNTKTDIETKKLRVLSCFGHDEISPCQHLKLSKNKQNHYCDKCGCGDHKHTWLVKSSEEYSKLDYPKLDCPLKMPGFTNYDPNFYTENSKQRKQQIENTDPEKLQFIQVTIGSNPQKEKIFEELNKINNNS
jgi:hypothetical protein